MVEAGSCYWWLALGRNYLSVGFDDADDAADGDDVGGGETDSRGNWIGYKHFPCRRIGAFYFDAKKDRAAAEEKSIYVNASKVIKGPFEFPSKWNHKAGAHEWRSQNNGVNNKQLH